MPKKTKGQRNESVPYQFEVPLGLREEAVNKAKECNTSVAPFMRMAMELFLDRPIQESQELLRKHNASKNQRPQIERHYKRKR